MNRTRFVVGPVCALGLLVAFSGCDVSFGPTLRGSGIMNTESRAVDSFSEIEVGSAIELEVTIGPAADLVVTADDNILPYLKTEVSRDRLNIYLDASSTSGIQVKVSATVPELKALVASGATRTTLIGVAGEHFQLDLSGASTCQLTSDADVMDVKLSGASHGTLTGSAKELTLECSGASRVTATEFQAEKVAVELSGASTARVHATNELSAEASGASTLRYAGEPAKLEKEISGASTVAAE
jgi:hypothetical protein